jgi:hypothetical protein
MIQIPQTLLFIFSTDNPVCDHQNLLYNSPQRYKKIKCGEIYDEKNVYLHQIF